jgi:hypothetical protein
MTRASAPDLPALCIQEAIDCQECSSSTAKELARACPGLPGKLITRLFVQIHTYPACGLMHANFTRAYITTDTAPLPAKKAMGLCGGLAAIAAA